MAKAPALSTQLKTAQARIIELEKKVESLTKDRDMWYKYYQDDKKVLEELHTLLDTLPNTVPRKSEANYSEYSVMIRLASYFANNKGV